MASDNAKIFSLFPVPDAAPDDATEQDNLVLAEPPDVCPKCYGTGMEVVAGKGARPCHCRKQEKRAKWLEAAHIPRRYEKCSFQNFYPSQGKFYNIQLNAFKFAFTLAREYPAVDRGL